MEDKTIAWIGFLNFSLHPRILDIKRKITVKNPSIRIEMMPYPRKHLERQRHNKWYIKGHR